MKKPEPDEYPAYFQNYIDSAGEGNVIEQLEKQLAATKEFFTNLPLEKETYRYAEGKWSIKELLGHIVDTERVMSYRAMRIARNDSTPLAGFDENKYVANASFDERSMYSLIEEYTHLRSANIVLFKSFSPEALNRRGKANAHALSVRALLYIIAGHERHHLRIIRERYLEEAVQEKK